MPLLPSCKDSFCWTKAGCLFHLPVDGSGHLFDHGVIGAVQSRLGALARHAGADPGDQIDPVIVEPVGAVPALGEMRLEGHGHENAGLAADGGTGEAVRGDADHGERLAVDLHDLIEHIGLAAELLLPIAIVDHRDRVAGAGYVVVGGDQAAQQRLRTHHFEIVAGDQHHRTGDGLAGEGDIGGKGAEAGDGSRFGRFFQLAKGSPIEDVVRAAGIVGVAAAILEVAGRGEEHQLFRMGNRKRAQHDLVEKRKDGGIDADTESQRQNHHRTEQRRFRQTAKSKTNPSHAADLLG